MEIEKMKSQLRGKVGREGARAQKVEVSNGRLKSENAEIAKATTAEVPSIRLAPEQIEEIHADEYSLSLFYATRIEPMSVADIKREFPEPEPKKAQSVMERFVKVGLVHITKDGRYYSNYPDNYINYSHYRYDNDLEAKKDSKVFRLMKEFTGNKEYWRDKTYFSMDAFYTQEQTAELLEMFRQIKLKAKDYANQNAKKKTTKGMKFRRMKFYDMNFAILLAFFISCLGLMAPKAALAGGNDPHIRAAMLFDRNGTLDFIARAGGGNDPTAAFAMDRFVHLASATGGPNPPVGEHPGSPGGGGHDPNDPKKLKPDCNGGHDPDPRRSINPDECGGGGHDPTDIPPSCVLEIEGERFPVMSPSICKLKQLLDFSVRCGISLHPICIQARHQIEALAEIIERGED